MPNGKSTFSAFDQGAVPTIACFVDHTTRTPLGVKLDELVAALQVYVDEHVAPVWGTPARLVQTNGFVKGAWAIVFLDDADQKGALAYHDLTEEGLRLSKVFVRTTLNNGDSVSVSASHELVEMLVDPAINMMTTGPDIETAYGYESADPVEEKAFDIGGISMSDFVYPSYFEALRAPGSTRFDHLNVVRRPFEILPGGYQIIFQDGHWGQVFGSASKGQRFSREDRRGHRSEARKERELMRASTSEIARIQSH